MKNLKPNPLLIVLGILLAVISSILLINDAINKKTVENNKKVEVVILDCSYTFRGVRKDYFLEFSLNGKTHVKRIKGFICDQLRKGQIMEVYTNESESNFVLPMEIEKDKNYFFGAILLITSLIIIYKGFKS